MNEKEFEELRNKYRKNSRGKMSALTYKYYLRLAYSYFLKGNSFKANFIMGQLKEVTIL